MAGELLQKLEKLRDIINKKNNEDFAKNAVEVINPSRVDEDAMEPHTGVFAEIEMLSVEKSLRKSISEESDAISAYLGRAKKALENGDESLYVLYKEIAADEVVHEAQLREALDLMGLKDKAKELKGKIEAHEILCSGGVCEAKEDDNVKKQRQLRNKADKAAKDFDFVAEYSKGRLKQAREKVVAAINDLIVGKADLESAVSKILKDGKKIAKAGKSDSKEKKEDGKDNE